MTTPRIPPMSLTNPDPAVKPTFDAFIAARGSVPNLFRTLAWRPAIMTAYQNLMGACLNQGTVPTALKELCVIRVSLINGCEY
jgi:alkylhydroperoxidase family enzyme